jgi:excisionase family DNA binding protein
VTSLEQQAAEWVEAVSPGQANDRFLEEFGLECAREAVRLGCPQLTVDLHFLVFLRRFARFGFFQFGPLSIDVRIVEELVDRGLPRGGKGEPAVLGDDLVRFSKLLTEEAARSGQRRIDELVYLVTFMRWREGVPGRVFGELGVTPENVMRFAREQRVQSPTPERLYSPEEAAEYLGVHVQTVRGWIRSGRLRASRLAGQRALRIRASDLDSVLEPVDPNEV